LDKDAEITVFLVGKWAHSRTNPVNGTHWLYDKNNAVVLNDKPTKEVDDIDPFQLTLAHEFVHCLGFLPHIEGRNHVLMSTGLQSLRITREVVEVIGRY
jgi:hypothetical protein